MDGNKTFLGERKRTKREKEALLKALRAAHEDADVIQKCMGIWGRWHFWICFAIYLIQFSIVWHQINIIIEAPAVTFTCIDNSDKCAANCSKHIFDRSVFTETIITQWDLVCNKHYLSQLTQTITMFGVLVGNILFGIWSDRCGRKNPFVFAIIIQVIAGSIAGFVPAFWALILLRFLTNVGTGGTMLTSFVLIMELVGTRYRCAVATLFRIPFNIGHFLLAVFGYFIRDWRYQQLAISLPSVVLISYYWILPESPRWLITVGKTERAIKILERAARVNRLQTENIRADVTEFAHKKIGQPKASGQLLDLVRTKNMALKTVCMGFNWFSCGLCFYGGAQYAGRVEGNLFVNIALGGLAQIPGTILTIFVLEKFGRRKSLLLSQLISGIPMLIIPLVPEGYKSAIPGLASTAIFGLSILWGVVYLYSGELFPTVVRNVGCGTSSMMARVGSIIAPFISTLDSTSIGWLPPVIFGVTPLIAALTCIFLPETANCELPNTIEEANNFGKKASNESEIERELMTLSNPPNVRS